MIKGIKNVIVAGGVAANNGLRTAMKELTDELINEGYKIKYKVFSFLYFSLIFIFF